MLIRKNIPKHDSFATLLWVLSLLFATRVLGQAVQRWAPQAFLPPFNAFQGSTLSYGLLLTAQLIILAAMIRFAWCVQTRSLTPSDRAARVLMWAGWTYMVVSVGRIAIGLGIPAVPAWFTTWIPAVFHVVLAAYVVALAYYHRRYTQPSHTR